MRPQVTTPVSTAPAAPASAPIAPQVRPAAAAAQAFAASTPATPAPRYSDLFAEIRAGFRLPNPNEPLIAQEARWYANHPQFLQRAFGRADMYLYYIVMQLEARHMPLELSLLPVIESAFRPYAYSWARAAGMWQFTSGTGRLFGLKQDWWYDGRLDVIASTNAALNYLQQLHDQLGGHWLLAIAAYDCGVLNVQRAIRLNRAEGRPTDFWHLRLPRETEAYVPQLLAMARLVKDPAKYGLSFSPIPDRPYFARVATDGQINLEVAAQLAGISSDEIYQLNPAFHRWATDPTGPFYLLLPEDAAPMFEENVANLTADERMGVTEYVVHRGDSVYSVARRFKTSPAFLRMLNTLPHGRMVVGEDIEVPATAYQLPVNVRLAAARVDHAAWRGRFHFHVVRVRRGESLWTIARQNGMSVRRLAQINGISVRHTLQPGERLRLYADARAGRFTGPRFEVRVVRVRPGDTLWSIARRNHVSVHTLASLNGLHSGQVLRPGQRLKIWARGVRAVRHMLARVGQGARRVIYTVRSGDTLWQIAQHFQVKVAQILAWNEMNLRTPITAGQKIMILADSGG